MPGEKRKFDEDTWIVSQSKKFKCGQLLANVYATTLAQLRLGARNFFKSADAESSFNRSVLSEGSNSSGARPSSPYNSPPSSPFVTDLMTDMLPCPEVTPIPQDVCSNCRPKKDGWENCYYCDKLVCHLNSCEGCQYGFCYNCCIAKYDCPSGETYSCYGCLH